MTSSLFFVLRLLEVRLVVSWALTPAALTIL